jgi:hypothetical protein
VAEESSLTACPVHFHSCSLIWTATIFSCVPLHSSFRITQWYLVILCVTFHVLHTYTMTDLTLLLKVLNFFCSQYFPSLPHWISWIKAVFALLNHTSIVYRTDPKLSQVITISIYAIIITSAAK